MIPLPSVTLVLGGARSGKSRFAEALIEAVGGGVYIATAEAGDGEMRDRITKHRARRGDIWRTVEEPLDLIGALKQTVGRPALVDCLTLWLSNVMLAGKDPALEVASLVAGLSSLDAPVVFVSNEVGLGIVPDNALAREFRDAAGVMNQRIATAASRVVFVAAGLPMTLKDQT
ncbi:MAG: bifunctional adenosylcobinamide kinase/adenosylcobinamide-phosphate guanylyltransferase [Proteobacteria bacterium]|nr:bifunctional adenosylcobinamide kinase/adenosylcobinamide-phosphate guanylyltransferase [Pseudomonadota bacterium]